MLNPNLKFFSIGLIVSFILGALTVPLVLATSGYELVPRDRGVSLEDFEDLELANDQLAAQVQELRGVLELQHKNQIGPGALPYSSVANPRAEIAEAKSLAETKDGGIVMITFGANWCSDCLTLHQSLNQPDVTNYVADMFEFVNVDIGEFNKNLDVAEEFGVSLEKGVPVAIFLDAAGDTIGTTNKGELDAARLYTSKQILRFVRDVAERRRIAPPDGI